MTIQRKMQDFFSSVLPEKLLKTLRDYDDFTAHQAPTDIKSFGAYHLACKNALSHIVLLFKMLQAAGANESSGDTNAWLIKAKQAIGLGESENEENDSDIDGVCMDLG